MYRARRHRRQICFGAVILSITILTAGIMTVDQVTNSLVSGKQRFSIAAFENRGDIIEITFMDRTFRVDLEYLKSDLKKLRRIF